MASADNESAPKRFYVRITGQVHGPLTGDGVQKMADRRQLDPSGEISVDGRRWVLASKVKGLRFPPAEILESSQSAASSSSAARNVPTTSVSGTASNQPPPTNSQPTNAGSGHFIVSPPAQATESPHALPANGDGTSLSGLPNESPGNALWLSHPSIETRLGLGGIAWFLLAAAVVFPRYANPQDAPGFLVFICVAPFFLAVPFFNTPVACCITAIFESRRHQSWRHVPPQMCWFCETAASDSPSAVFLGLYRYFSGGGVIKHPSPQARYSQQRIRVCVPRCKACDQLHRRAFYISTAIAVAGLLIVGAVLLLWDGAHVVAGNAAVVFILIIAIGVVGYSAAHAVMMMSHPVTVKALFAARFYPPVAALIATEGWHCSLVQFAGSATAVEPMLPRVAAGDMMTMPLSELIEYSQDASASIRREVALALAKRRATNQDSIAVLIRLLERDVTEVRSAAALAIGDLGVRDKAVVDALRRAQHDHVSTIRRLARDALTKLSAE